MTRIHVSDMIIKASQGVNFCDKILTKGLTRDMLDTDAEGYESELIEIGTSKVKFVEPTTGEKHMLDMTIYHRKATHASGLPQLVYFQIPKAEMTICDTPERLLIDVHDTTLPDNIQCIVKVVHQYWTQYETELHDELQRMIE